jgi:hypothetical protein
MALHSRLQPPAFHQYPRRRFRFLHPNPRQRNLEAKDQLAALGTFFKNGSRDQTARGVERGVAAQIYFD